MATNQFENLTGILKFEYSHGRTNPHDLFKFNNMYFTCSPKRPRQLSSDKLLFLTILDDCKNNPPKIIGRARTHGFTDNNVASPQMIKEYQRLSHYKYFVDLYDIEVIKGNIEDGIDLYKVIEKYEKDEKEVKDMFPDTKATNAKRAYAQQSYRIISDEAKDDINSKLEEIGLEKI